MKIQRVGYIKLHRKFLSSHVRKLNSATVCLFIDLLLLADQNGQIITTIRELMGTLEIGSHHTLMDSLEQLEKANVVSIVRKPSLLITVLNWGTYQARKSVAESATRAWQKVPQTVAGSATSVIHRVPVTLSDCKNNKNIFIPEKNSFNFQDPKTDLEKLVHFYLKGTGHPGLAKGNNNETLNAAVKMDIPHFKTVLANCRDLQQAEQCVKFYILQTKGTYSMYYLACQINSIRQEVESKEYKRGKI